MKKKFLSFLLSVTACLALCFSIVFALPTVKGDKTVKATSYNTKDIAMLGSIAGWYDNGNFEVRLTLGEADWTNDDAGEKAFDTTKGLGDLPTLLKNLDFFNHIEVGGKTLAEWGCTSCYKNIYWLNDSEPDYTLKIPLAMGSENIAIATAAGVGSHSRLTIKEGALVPSYAYLKGDATATVYRAGCDFVTEDFASVAYGIMAKGKTEVESVRYVQGHDGRNGYFGVSLKGDDFLGDGTQAERCGEYHSDVYTTNLFPNKITVDDVAGKAESYGLFNLGSKGQGYFSFSMIATEDEMQSITIPAGTIFPSRAMKTLYEFNSNPVYIMYETQTDVTFYKQSDGTWAKEIETSVSDAQVFVNSDDGSSFAGIKLALSNYEDASNTYSGGARTVLSYAQSSNFLPYVLINDVALATPGEAFLNVWGHYGYFTFRPGTDSATKITILKGCRFPTLNAIVNGVDELYVVTEDVTFIKNEDGEWKKYVPEGDFDTAVTQVQFGRSTNVLNINLSVNDYPSPDGNDSSTYNLGVDADVILSLNLFDNIIVDGYTLRSRYNNYSDSVSGEWMWVNKFVGHNFAITVPNVNGDALTPSKIIIRAGAQFPSLAYINGEAQAYYVTQEEVTYVRISDDVEEKWEKQAKISFVADGNEVSTLKYTTALGINGEIPEVPEKQGYKGVWESYTLNGEDLVVNATYTAHSFTETETNLSGFEYKEAFLIVFLTNHDYTDKGYTIDVKERVVNLHFFNYVEIDGTMVATSPTASTGAFLNVWGGYEGAFATYVPNGLVPTSKIVFKKGCQIPSYAYCADSANMTCYVLNEDVTFIYDEDGESWVRQSNGEDEVVSSKPTCENDYILSDLYSTGHSASAELEKGYLLVDSSTDGNVYGYNTSNSFSLTFDFSLNIGDSDVSAQGEYANFAIAMATRGYNSAHTFGWRFYLYRPNSSSKCVEFYTVKGVCSENGNIATFEWDTVQFEKNKTYSVTIGYKLIDEETGKIEIYVNVDGNETLQTFELGSSYMEYAPYVDSIGFTTSSAIENGVRISDPGLAEDEENHTVTLSDGTTQILTENTNVYELPSISAYEYGDKGDVFVGWTTDLEKLSTLYPVGYELKLTGDTTLYPVWINFSLRDGAGVRKTGASGIRFLVDVDGNAYDAWSTSGLILGSGTLVVPTSYLDGGKSFVHESFPEGYFIDVPTETWTVQSGDVYTFTAALVNISPAQYTRSMSARGYLKIKFSDESVGYIYTPYSKDLHARSIYEVATSAYNAGYTGTAVTDYLNSVADVVIGEDLELYKNENAVGNYTITYSKADLTYTVTVDSAVKTVVINGVRMVAGYEKEVVIANCVYGLSEYKLSSNGLTFTFTLERGEDEIYYSALVEYYANSDDYTELHKEQILAIIEEWGGNYSDAEVNATNLAKLESIKTAVELKNNVGVTKLATPVVTYGLGYSVTWAEVPNADYYLVTDDNDYRNGVYVTTNSYRPEVVGNHNVTVTAYSYSEEYSTSDESSSFATVEVKPVFAYKAMSNGLYKFTSSQLSSLGISDLKDSCYYDSTQDEYFVYYNKDTGWSANQANGTDWTSPAEFPAHAQRLKDLGLNLILIPEDNNASYKSTDVWQTSRLKYVMDTAWSIGLKVIVCEDDLYNASSTTDSKDDFKSLIEKSTGFKYYVQHPAFYGFSLTDEPEPDTVFTDQEINCVGYAIQALKEVCANTYGLSKANGNEPFFLSCLYQYSSGFDYGSLFNYYEEYVEDWFSNTELDYVYVDLYTGHAMGDNTDRFVKTYNVLYGSDGTGGCVTGTSGRKFYQVITAHTQDKDTTGYLTEQDLYMSMLYSAAHNVAGYSWFCYFPIMGELAGSMVGYDGNGYGNGNGLNGAQDGKSYYSAAQISNYQFELIQGLLNGYSFASRSYSDSTYLLTTTLSNGSKTATFYVNADTQSLSATTPSVTASGSECYLVGYGLDGYYQVVTSGTSVTLAPGQALICIN